MKEGWTCEVWRKKSLEKERDGEKRKREKERKETKTVCDGLRRRDVKVPCHTSRCVQRSHIHTHDHIRTHTITHTHTIRERLKE